MSQIVHTVSIDRELCKGSMACVQSCPAEAIRVRKGKAVILDELCVDCGECIQICPNNAIKPQTSSFIDFSQYKYTIAVPSPVLYSQFDRKFSPNSILKALRQIGFDDAADVTYCCESVSLVIREFLTTYHGPVPLISPFCPAVVRLIQNRYPDLRELLLPIESPMEICARDQKLKKSRELNIPQEEIGAIYITPCPAKINSILCPPRKEESLLNGGISISEIYNSLLSVLSSFDKNINYSEDRCISGIGVGWAVMGGEAKSLQAENTLAVAGLHNVIRILDDIEKGRLRDLEYVECLACPEGCVGGSLTVGNPYISRSKIIRLTEQFSELAAQDWDTTKDLYDKGHFLLSQEIPSIPPKLLDKDIGAAIQKMKMRDEIVKTLPGTDCGACGAPTCASFARDVVNGDADINMCVFKVYEKIKKISSQLTELLNGSAFMSTRNHSGKS